MSQADDRAAVGGCLLVIVVIAFVAGLPIALPGALIVSIGYFLYAVIFKEIKGKDPW